MMVGADIHQVRHVPAPGRSRRDRCFRSEISPSPPTTPSAPRSRSSPSTFTPARSPGIAGIAGNGQSELFDVISGELPAGKPEQVEFLGTAAGHLSVSERRALGAVFISEERLGHATVPAMSLSENVILTRHGVNPGLVNGALIDRGKARTILEKITAALDVRKSAEDPRRPVAVGR